MFLTLVRYQTSLPQTRHVFPGKEVERVVASWGRSRISKASNGISFTVPFWGHRSWYFLAPIDQGRITMNSGPDGVVTIRMDLSMIRILVVAGVGSVVAGVLSQSLQTGSVAFLWLAGGNWLVTLYRARSRFNKLVECFQP